MTDPEPLPYSAALFENWDAALPSSLRAAASGDPAAISAWFRTASCVRGSDSRGWRALHVAVRVGRPEGLQAVLAGLRSRPELQMQEELDALTFCGLSPLHMAFERRRFDLAKTLLEAGARPNLTQTSQENELSLLFQACMEQIDSSLPPLTVPVLELLHKAGARPDRPEVRLFVTPLVVLVQESRSSQLADHPAALELVGHVIRLWPDLELCAGGQKNCFLLQCLLWAPIGGVAKALWAHFKGRGVLSWAALKAVEGADDLLCRMLDLGNMEAASLLLDCGFDPLQWTSEVVEEAEVAGEADYHVTEEEFGREPAEDSPEDTRLEHLPFYREEASCVCPLSVAMALQNHEIVWRMLDLRTEACGLCWQEFVESCRTSRAFSWLLRVAKKRGPTWRPPALPAVAGRFGSRALLWQLIAFKSFIAPPTVTDWAILEWTARNGGRFPLSPGLAKAYFRVLLHSRGAFDPRPSPALLLALSTCPEDEAAAWAALLEEAPLANCLQTDSKVADGLFRLTLSREPLFLAAVALGARPSSSCGLLDLLKDSQHPAAMWTVSAVLMIANDSSPADLDSTGPFPLEWLVIAALRKALERNGHRTEKHIRAALSSIKLPVKLRDLVALTEASGPRLCKKAADICSLLMNNG